MSLSSNETKGHHSANTNFNYVNNIIRYYDFLNGWYFKIHDYDVHTGLVKNPMYLEIYGKHKGSNYSYPISFHQDTDKFEKEFGDTIRMLESTGYIEKHGSKKMISSTKDHKNRAIYFAQKYPPSANPLQYIVAHEHHVEIVLVPKRLEARYDLPDDEWKRKTQWT